MKQPLNDLTISLRYITINHILTFMFIVYTAYVSDTRLHHPSLLPKLPLREGNLRLGRAPGYLSASHTPRIADMEAEDDHIQWPNHVVDSMFQILCMKKPGVDKYQYLVLINICWIYTRSSCWWPHRLMNNWFGITRNSKQSRVHDLEQPCVSLNDHKSHPSKCMFASKLILRTGATRQSSCIFLIRSIAASALGSTGFLTWWQPSMPASVFPPRSAKALTSDHHPRVSSGICQGRVCEPLPRSPATSLAMTLLKMWRWEDVKMRRCEEEKMYNRPNH